MFCTLAAIGILRLIYDFCMLKKRKRFGLKYLERYNQLLHSSHFDEECYRWLLRNLQKMANEMGVLGTVASYKPPFSNYLINNYPIVVNTIMHLREETTSESDFRSVQTHLERYIGALDYVSSRLRFQVFNPFRWLTRAVRLILVDGPLWILQAVGLIGENSSNAVRHHSATGKIVAIITILGTLVSIISGWDELVKFFKAVLQWLGLLG